MADGSCSANTRANEVSHGQNDRHSEGAPHTRPESSVGFAWIPASKLLEDTLAKVHKSAAWRDYMARNMFEDVYMNGEEFGKWLAAQQVETLQFLTETGLALKK